MTDHAAPHLKAADAVLEQGKDKSLLRFLTCGSVDDGKSTLIGRLLYDTRILLEDQLTALERDSARQTGNDGSLDFALLVDGLEAEREQGITIDVAYRFFATERRKFIVADTPGHEEYTRNMATGASTADLAVILVDARKGILPQTRRHFYIASLLGIREFILAVNKIDLVGYSEATFDAILQDFSAFTAKLRISNVTAIPLSARHGDNVAHCGEHLGWYKGPTLLQHLEKVEIGGDLTRQPFRMPVQWINRPHRDFRGYAGTIASGRIRPGEEISVAGSGVSSRVRSIVTFDGDLKAAYAGDAVTLVLEDEVDVSRGDVLAIPQTPPDVADQFAAHLIWMHQDPMVPGRLYLFKTAGKTVVGSFTKIKHLVEINSLQHLAAKSIGMNGIGLVNASLREAIAFDPYETNHQTGSFIVIDRHSNLTVGAGMIEFALRRASNLHWQETALTQTVRGHSLGQRPAAIWFTGLSGAGKSTLANLLEQRLFSLGCHTYLLDGDNVRHGLNRDLGFTESDRVENIRRVAEVARLFVDAGLIVLVSLISPYRSERGMARDLFKAGEFIEVFVDTPLEVAEKRDPKGLYKKARAGIIKNFTGIDSPYEPPEDAEITLDAASSEPDKLVEEIITYLRRSGFPIP